MAHRPRLRQALRCAPDGPPRAEKIKQPLAEELLFGKLVNGGEVKVRIKDNNAPSFEITPAAPKPVKAKGKSKAKAADKKGAEPAAE